MRKNTRTIYVGDVPIGGGHPIAVQSMTNTDTRDVMATVRQIHTLIDHGCELVRAAVIDQEAAAAIASIKKEINIPIIADIHFDYRLAIAAMDNGVDGLRLNPGNIGGRDQISSVVQKAREREIPIRIGVNAGSLEKDILQKHGKPTSDALVESALRHTKLLEDLGYDKIKISIKSSDVPLMVDSYRKLSQTVDYPLHLGVTEAGTILRGSVKSALGIGILLAEGIGDTIRVSLTGAPEMEVFVAYQILNALNLRKRGLELVSCPTCGRCQIDLIEMAEQVERRLAWIRTPIKVAVMGCPVNGPGEAAHCDIGIAGGNKKGLLFKHGKIIANVPQEELIPRLEEEIKRMINEVK